MIAYGIRHVWPGWAEIVTKTDEEGKPTGGIIVPTRYLSKLVKSAGPAVRRKS